MKNKSLSAMTKEQLVRMARKMGVAVKPNQLKNAIIKAIEKEEKRSGAKSGGIQSKESKKKQVRSGASGGQGRAGKKTGSPSKAPAKSPNRIKEAEDPTESPRTSRRAKKSVPKGQSRAKSQGSEKSTGGAGKSKSTRKGRPSAVRTGKPSAPSVAPLKADQDQQAKFKVAHPDTQDESGAEPIPNLPDSYGKDVLVILPRDPYWVFVYWDVNEHTLRNTLERLQCSADSARWILRVSTPFKTGFTDTEVGPSANSWYLHLSRPGTGVKAELGLKNPNGRFEPLVYSNHTALPTDRPSEREDLNWVWTDETFQVRSAGQPEGNALPDFSRPQDADSPSYSFSSHNLQRKR